MTAAGAAVRVAALGYATVAYLGAFMLGVYVVPAAVTTATLAVAVAAGLLVREGRPVSPRNLWAAALVGAGAVPFAVGLGGLGAAAFAPVVVLLACGGVFLVGRGQSGRTAGAAPHDVLEDLPEGVPEELARGQVAVADDEGPLAWADDQQEVAWADEEEQIVRAALTAASLEALFRQWHNTGRELASRRSQRGMTTLRLRELLLAELERRDAEGVRRWLLEGPADCPQRYVSSGG